MKGHILIVDDDPGHLAMLNTVLSSLGHCIEQATDGLEAVRAAQKNPYDLILMDVRMANLGGIEALQKIKGFNPAIPIIIMTAYSSVDKAVNAMKLGAYDYLTKPLNFDELRMTLQRAMTHLHLSIENRVLREKISQESSFSEIIGSSPAMKKVIETAKIAAPSEATILITGESGTGKELFARAIHKTSDRRDHLLVVVNCAALTETLLESELFGHEKGAFTGADRRRDGLFLQADKGTLFLDEIGEMPLSMQVKLLRALQEKEIQSLGSDRTTKVNVRIIAATNRDLEQDVKNKTFREDLFYRLNVVNIEAPPLRARKGDVPLLAQHFLDTYSKKNRKDLKGFTPASMDALTKYNWPGNVRELENSIERAVILCIGHYISEKDLLPGIIESFKAPAIQPGSSSLHEVETLAIIETLERTKGNKSRAAEILNITRTTLNNKLKKYGILPPRDGYEEVSP
ncbi:MAG: sigma-54 dependent transcriptional regulator [Proteobacteria bacterium]|nr:sigma-54-dependent Fis family transcriptional regulator [Desulfobacula sp.]MBU3953741.1 sigma-54 dependent transcriptional regulator [Pseudomonadota bacterium]MBU4133149.1 sigma-54 dependent transcriptional regulator [Pseudomonadota bacterium]